MTADLRAAAEKVLADNARDREQLLAEQLDAEAARRQPKWAGRRWHVVRQVPHRPDHTVCGHRYELAAEWCARRFSTRHPSDTGGHYTARRAES